MHHFCTSSVGQNEEYDPNLTAGKAGREASKYSLLCSQKEETGSVSIKLASATIGDFI